MFCKHCGHEIDINAIICTNCGVATDNINKTVSAPAVQKNTMALIGFILSFFVPLVGLILSIIGYQNVKKPEYAGDGKNFAIAGIAISAVSLGVSLISGVIVGLIWYSLFLGLLL